MDQILSQYVLLFLLNIWILELIESTMYLYQATKDPYLLEVGIDILESIDRSTKTRCGYATVSTDYFYYVISTRVSQSMNRQLKMASSRQNSKLCHSRTS